MITSISAATGRRHRVLCVDDDALLLGILTKTIGVDYEEKTNTSSRVDDS
jgi:hypothetical protein